jgi:pyridoxine 5-phosphate synthase
MSAAPPIRLGVNIDHVATVRNARDGAAPDPLRAAKLALRGGANSITAHLREDRRHIRDDDIVRLRRELGAPLNLEMAATSQMVALAVELKPQAVCLVPERREERTTEGGLDIAAHRETVGRAISLLTAAGSRVALFVEPDPEVLDLAAELGAPAVELHTGAWCNAVAAGDVDLARDEAARIGEAARFGALCGLAIHAGHGLDTETAAQIATVPEIVELNIGHSIVGEALFVGMEAAVRAMRTAIDRGRARARVVRA